MNNDFSTVKMGDRLWSPTFGRMIISIIDDRWIYLRVQNNSTIMEYFDKRGVYCGVEGLPQSLFFEEMQLVPVSKPAEVKTFDPNKPYQRRDGKPARIICKDRKGETPYVYLTSPGGDSEEYICYTDKNGIAIPVFGSSHDLINIPEKIEGWINVYTIHESKKMADDCDFEPRLACLKVSFTKGEGL